MLRAFLVSLSAWITVSSLVRSIKIRVIALFAAVRNIADYGFFVPPTVTAFVTPITPTGHIFTLPPVPSHGLEALFLLPDHMLHLDSRIILGGGPEGIEISKDSSLLQPL